METNQQPTTSFELIPLTEEQHPVSALPKRTTELPFFYLTKKKNLLQENINYEGVDEAGRPIRWTVRPNRDPEIGAPAIDAHEIWVRIIIPTMEQHRTSGGGIPEILPLGGVRQCLRKVAWGVGGHQARRLLRGLNQIGAAWCEADFFLPTTDASGKAKLVPVKGKFSRLSIYAIGEKHVSDEQLAEGKFDFDFDLDATIYLQLHNLERAIQENQEHRYIDNQYMFSVEPTGRRWLEIMAAKIFGVVKNNGSHCEVRYSWYVKQHHTLKRHVSRKRVTDQMNHVAEDHITSGYILKPEYRPIKEPGQETDFIIRYKPGPMASQSTSRIRSSLKSPAGQLPAGESQARRPRQKRLPLQPEQPQPAAGVIHYQHLDQLKNRGIEETAARKLLSELPASYDVIATLEWGDQQIAGNPKKKWDNPAGFYIHLLKQLAKPPATFETSRARKAREEAEFAKAEAIQKEREAALKAEAVETASLQAQLDNLAEEGRLALFAEVKAAAPPQMAHWLTTADPEVNSFLQAGARKKIREGWKPAQAETTPQDENSPASEPENPHYATNQPTRQATHLQAFMENMQAVLTTPQLPAPAQETAVEPAPAELATDLL